MIACEICGKGPVQGVTVYRANEKGVKGRWRCNHHLNETAFQRAMDSEVSAIERAIMPEIPSETLN